MYRETSLAQRAAPSSSCGEDKTHSHLLHIQVASSLLSFCLPLPGAQVERRGFLQLVVLLVVFVLFGTVSTRGTSKAFLARCLPRFLPLLLNFDADGRMFLPACLLFASGREFFFIAASALAEKRDVGGAVWVCSGFLLLAWQKRASASGGEARDSIHDGNKKIGAEEAKKVRERGGGGGGKRTRTA